jgi:hypothetical protein
MRTVKTQLLHYLRNASNNSVLISATPVILLLALFVFLGFHGVASSDDYADYALVQKMGFGGAIQETYLHWGGRFISYFIVFLLNPLNFGEQWGPAILNTIQLLLFLSIPFLITKILYKKWNLSNELIISFSLITGFILCYLPSTVELLYWFTGSWVYLPGLVFMLYWYVLIEKENKSKINKILIVLLPFIIAGSNEINILIMAWLILFAFIKSNRERFCYLAIIAFVIGAAFELLTPGNMQRSNFFLLEAHHPARDFLFSINASFQLTFHYLKDWFRSTPILLVWLALALIKPIGNIHFSTRMKVFSGLSIFMIPLLFFPFIYATGMTNPPERLLNVIFIFLFIAGYFLFNVLFDLIYKRSSSQTILASIIALVLLFQASYSSNLRTALFDLKELSFYQKELDLREHLVDQHAKVSSQDTLHLPAIKHIPQTIFYSDLSSNAGHWYNQGFAYFHGINAVVIDDEIPIK